MRRLDCEAAVAALGAGDIIAYPTESVFGLGCDPMNEAAVRQLLTIKGRSADKGLIVIGSNYQQLDRFMGEIPANCLDRAKNTWPGPVTWLFPAHPDTPPWLTGHHDTIALRVPDHPVCHQLCEAFGPLISTSANRAGQPPAVDARELDTEITRQIAGVVDGVTGGRERPSEIRSLLNDGVIRHG